MENFLQNKPFDRNDAVNADLMDDLASVVVKQYSAAKKAKKAVKVKILVTDKETNLAQLTEAYIGEGMSCIGSKGGDKKERKKKGARERRNRAAFDELARLASVEPEEAENGTEAPTPAEVRVEAPAEAVVEAPADATAS